MLYDPGSGTPVEARVRVLAAAEENRHPSVNRPALQMLAHAAGGQMVELSKLDTLAGQFKGQPRTVHVLRDASLWDNWLMLVLLAGIYSLDVGLRRLGGLQ